MDYRTATPADEPALHALWAAAFPDPAPVIALWSQDPGRHRRTFVAVDAGRPVSVVHYLPRPIRSATGRPQRVGCLGSVATHPEARGRGHVRRLLAAAVAAMTADGCAWSLLFTATPAVYEGAGWRSFAAPGWSGPPTGPAPGPAGPVTVRPALPADLPALQALRATFDASRPLTTVRTAEDWQHRIPVWYAPPTETLIAETGTETGSQAAASGPATAPAPPAPAPGPAAGPPTTGTATSLAAGASLAAGSGTGAVPGVPASGLAAGTATASAATAPTSTATAPTSTATASTSTTTGSRPVGFLVVRHPRPGRVEIAEIALARGHGADVAGALFGLAGARARGVGARGVDVRLPAVRAVREALPLLLAEVTAAPTRFGMARPLGATADEVIATVSAPGAVHWYGDSF